MVFIPVRVSVGVVPVAYEVGLIARVGTDTVVVAVAMPVTDSVRVSVPVPAPVVQVRCAAVVLVTVTAPQVTLATPLAVITVDPLQDVPDPVSVSVMFPACPLGITVGAMVKETEESDCSVPTLQNPDAPSLPGLFWLLNDVVTQAALRATGITCTSSILPFSLASPDKFPPM